MESQNKRLTIWTFYRSVKKRFLRLDILWDLIGPKIQIKLRNVNKRNQFGFIRIQQWNTFHLAHLKNKYWNSDGKILKYFRGSSDLTSCFLPKTIAKKPTRRRVCETHLMSSLPRDPWDTTWTDQGRTDWTSLSLTQIKPHYSNIQHICSLHTSGVT